MNNEDRKDIAYFLRKVADDIENPEAVRRCSIEVGG